MKSHKSLINAAHPLRDEVRPGYDYLGNRTTGRITVAEAIARFGEQVVRKAMACGDIYAEYDGVEGIASTFDFGATAPNMRLRTNNVLVG